jgi:hypothetical protein
MPESHEAFLELVGKYTVEQQQTVVDRMITCHNIRLLAVNRGHMATLFGILVEHVAHQFEDAGDELSLGMAGANALAKPLFDVTQQVPKSAAKEMRAQLQAIETTLKASWTFPDFSDLIKFKIVATLFPTSDLRHSVVYNARFAELKRGCSRMHMGLTPGCVQDASNTAIQLPCICLCVCVCVCVCVFVVCECLSSSLTGIPVLCRHIAQGRLHTYCLDRCFRSAV